MTYPPPPGQPSYPPPVDPYDSPPEPPPAYAHTPVPGYPPQPPPTQVQPAYPPPGYAPPPPVAPRTESRTVAITLVAAAIALTLVVGGGVAFYLAGAKFGGDRSGALGTEVSPSPSASAATQVRIREPLRLGGNPKIDAPEFSSLTSDMEKELEGYPGAQNEFGAVYGDLAAKKLIAALAAEVDIDDPQQMLDTMFQSFSGINQLTGVTPASTGSLGGVAQCGSALIGEADVALCGWADEGSVGMILYFAKTAVDVKGDFPDMRAEIERRF